MPGTRELRQRIRSVGNTAKVTNAMQLIAASRLRRAQAMVAGGRAYSEKMVLILSHLVQQFNAGEGEEVLPPLLRHRVPVRGLLVILTPDRGLAGALVGNITREAGTTIMKSSVPMSVIAIGRKGERFIARTGQNLLASFSVSDAPNIEETIPVSNYIRSIYESGGYSSVDIVYAKFVNTATQTPAVKRLLPIEPPEVEDSLGPSFYIYEPSAPEVLDLLLPRYLETQVYQAVLEAIASEHSARMVAMKNATDNAHQLVEDLTLDLNRARQEYITAELLDIIGGVAALE